VYTPENILERIEEKEFKLSKCSDPYHIVSVVF